ncbi:MAG: DUF4190 domain-containing protein [Chitinophagaceae bacterium]|nr:DUF4190 domain-containing protein [Chitinophagaceae bacterium]
MRAFIIALSLILCLQVPSMPAQAAYPISSTQQSKTEKLDTKIEAFEKQELANALPAKDNKERDEDEGIFGILSFVTALMGIFPAAIVLGIIGLGRGRAQKGLATAGLVIGLIYLALILIFVALFFGFFYAL